MWRRSKSNLNLRNGKGFTHYLTRLAYADDKRIIEGQKVGSDTVNLKTEEDNLGLLCSLPVEILKGVKIDECFNKSDDFPLSVLLLVRQKKSEKGRIRLITCYPTSHSKYVEWYARRYYARPRTHSDDLEIDDFNNGTQKRESLKLSENEEFKKSALVFKKVTEELVNEMKENLFKGYQVFINSLPPSY